MGLFKLFRHSLQKLCGSVQLIEHTLDIGGRNLLLRLILHMLLNLRLVMYGQRMLLRKGLWRVVCLLRGISTMHWWRGLTARELRNYAYLVLWLDESAHNFNG
jgi:hypothetical protein